jgi:hypothetical protein
VAFPTASILDQRELHQQRALDQGKVVIGYER